MKPERIREVDLHLTNRCNLVCDHCSVDSGPNRSAWNEMTLDHWFRVIDEAAELGCRYADLTGGEPVLYHGVEAVARRALAAGMHVELQSNGILLTADRLARLREAGLGTLVVSVDGPEAEHDLMRGKPGVYRAAVQAIREAVAQGFRVRATRVFGDNVPADNFAAFARELDTLGVSHLSVNMFSPVTRKHFAAWRKPSPQAWRQTIEVIEHTASEVRYPITYEVAYATPDEAVDLFAEETRCLIERRRWFLIRSDGEIYPCYHFVHRPEMSLGNVQRRHLGELVEASEVWGTYSGIHELPDGCGDCSFASSCRGGCPSPGYLNLGRMTVKDVRCAVENGFIPVCPFVKRRAGTRHATNISPYYAPAPAGA